MRQLAPFLRPYWGKAGVGAAFKLTEAIFELIIPVVMARLIDVGIGGGDLGYALSQCGLMLLLAAGGLGCAAICQYFASVASQGFGTALRNALFDQVSRFSNADLDRFGASSLSVRTISDVNQLQLAVAMLIRLAIRAPFLCAGGLVSAFLIDSQLALVMVGAILCFAVALPLIMHQSIRLYGLVQQRLDHLAQLVGETLSGVRVIRAFARTHSENERFDRANDAHQRAATLVGRISALSNPLTTLIINAGVVCLIYLGGLRLEAGRTTSGNLVALINYMSQILLALIVLANLVVIFTKALASLRRVSEVLAHAPSIAQPAHPQPLPEGPLGVTFEDVSFRYGEHAQPVLEHISFTAQPGQAVGVVGLTGAGKSTLVQLIPRLYDVTGGRVLVGGVDVRALDLSQLRRAVGYVPQKATLFSGTVGENLSLGNPELPLAQLAGAAAVAQAAGFIERRPEGYDAPVERGGSNFSGGQRQRLAIARALAKAPSVLILDDSASALDLATEARLRQALAQHTRGLCTFIVSQRVSSVRHAGLILVLSEGRLAGQGTHEQLLANCPLYREICASQQREEAAP